LTLTEWRTALSFLPFIVRLWTFNAEDASAQHLNLLDFYMLLILGPTRTGRSFTLIMSLLNQAWDNGCWMSGISSMGGGRGINIVIA
jgi:hypothetical protein